MTKEEAFEIILKPVLARGRDLRAMIVHQNRFGSPSQSLLHQQELDRLTEALEVIQSLGKTVEPIPAPEGFGICPSCKLPMTICSSPHMPDRCVFICLPCYEKTMYANMVYGTEPEMKRDPFRFIRDNDATVL